MQTGLIPYSPLAAGVYHRLYSDHKPNIVRAAAERTAASAQATGPEFPQPLLRDLFIRTFSTAPEPGFQPSQANVVIRRRCLHADAEPRYLAGLDISELAQSECRQRRRLEYRPGGDISPTLSQWGSEAAGVHSVQSPHGRVVALPPTPCQPLTAPSRRWSVSGYGRM